MRKINAITKILFITTFLVSFTFVNTLHASVVTYSKDADGVSFVLDNGLMKVKICKNDIIEVKYTALAAFPSRTSLVVINSWKLQPEFKVSELSDKIVIVTDKLKIEVNRLTNAVVYSDVHDNLILAEDGQNGTTMAAASVAGINTYTCSTQFLSPADEALYGLGCHRRIRCR